MTKFLLAGFIAGVTLFGGSAKAQRAPRSPVPVPPPPSSLPPGKAAPQVTDIWVIFKTHCDQGVTLPDGAKFTTALPVNLSGEKIGAPLQVTGGKPTFPLGAYAPASFLLK